MSVSGEISLQRRVMVVAVVVAAALAGLFAAAASADPTPEAAVAELNTWRAEVGESPLSPTPVSAWNTGCQHHDNYDFRNKGLTHNEEGGHPGYTTDGKEAGENSVLSEAFSSPDPTPDANLLPGPTWDAAVFHRAALLQPRLAQTGFDSTTFTPAESEAGFYESFICMRTQGSGAIDESRTTPGLTLYPSPANGAYDVPTVFPAGTESPDPAVETGVPAGSTLGWLLNVEIDGPWATAGFGYDTFAHGVTATLAPDGTSNFVPLVVSQCGPSGCGGAGGTSEGVYFGGGFGIFPTQALAANTTYRVVLTGGTVTSTQPSTVNYPVTGYSWCFSTGATYTTSGDCAAPTTAGQEPIHPNASTATSVTPTGGSGGGSSGGSTGGGSTGASSSGSSGVHPGPAPAHCVVPKLTGKKLKVVRGRVAAASCRLGKVTRQPGPKAGKGRAAHQSPEPGKVLPAGSKVNVVIDKG